MKSANILKLSLLSILFPLTVSAEPARTLPVDNLTVTNLEASQNQPVIQQPAMPTQPMALVVPKSLQQQSQYNENISMQQPMGKNLLQPVNVLPKAADVQQVLNVNVNSQAKQRPQSDIVYGDNSQKFEKLLSDAYKNNPSINSARESLKAADEQVFQAFSGYLPKLNFTYGRNFQKVGYDNLPKKDYYLDNKTLGLTQGIFGGGETYYSVKSAESRVLAARNELRNIEQKFLFDAITAYINLIYSQKVLVLSKNNESVLKEQLNASQQRFIVGDATKTDVAQSQARLANANSSRVIAEGEFTNAQAEFKKIFSIEADEKLLMPSNLPDIPSSLDESLKLALENNPQLQQLKFLIDSNENDINVQESQLYPQVDANGSVSKSESPLTSGKLETDSQNVGVTVTVPIYNAGVAYSRTREARDRKSQTQQQYNDALNSTRSETIQAWQQISTTAANIEATKASLAASEFALEGVREEQKEGARTILDVLDAEQERFSAEINHARAIKDSVLAIYRLKAAVGELLPSKIGLDTADYDPATHYNNTKYKLIGL